MRKSIHKQQNRVCGRDKAGDEAKKLKQGQSWTCFCPRFTGPRKGGRRGANPCLWRDVRFQKLWGVLERYAVA